MRNFWWFRTVASIAQCRGRCCHGVELRDPEVQLTIPACTVPATIQACGMGFEGEEAT